ncbi:MAG: hypothetical protein KBS95_06145 [Alistipes sp.]|nr:hypothetical protein [Candidatus Alistipes equi]
MIRQLVIVVALLAGFCGFAQQVHDIPFNGLITTLDQEGIRLRIRIKDSDKATMSYHDGRFGFTNLIGNEVLCFKYKKKNFEIPVAGKQSIAIRMSDTKVESVVEDVSLINAGMAYVSARESIVSSSVLTEDYLRRGNFTSLAEAISSFFPGVDIGVDGSVTLNGNEILLVCNLEEIPSLNPIRIEDVKKIAIERDGAIFGERGLNGVMYISTKN